MRVLGTTRTVAWAAPLLFGLLLEPLGGWVLGVSSGLMLAALASLQLLRGGAPMV